MRGSIETLVLSRLSVELCECIPPPTQCSFAPRQRGANSGPVTTRGPVPSLYRARPCPDATRVGRCSSGQLPLVGVVLIAFGGSGDTGAWPSAVELASHLLIQVVEAVLQPVAHACRLRSRCHAEAPAPSCRAPGGSAGPTVRWRPLSWDDLQHPRCTRISLPPHQVLEQRHEP